MALYKLSTHAALPRERHYWRSNDSAGHINHSNSLLSHRSRLSTRCAACLLFALSLLRAPWPPAPSTESPHVFIHTDARPTTTLLLLTFWAALVSPSPRAARLISSPPPSSSAPWSSSARARSTAGRARSFGTGRSPRCARPAGAPSPSAAKARSSAPPPSAFARERSERASEQRAREFFRRAGRAHLQFRLRRQPLFDLLRKVRRRLDAIHPSGYYGAEPKRAAERRAAEEGARRALSCRGFRLRRREVWEFFHELLVGRRAKVRASAITSAKRDRADAHAYARKHGRHRDAGVVRRRRCGWWSWRRHAAAAAVAEGAAV